MSFTDWLKKGLIKTHVPSKQEISNLLGVADRCLADANIEAVSADGCFQSAYNAVLASATAALHANGYRTNLAAPGHHAITLESLATTIRLDEKTVRKLDGLRRKRHRTSYDVSGSVSQSELSEMLNLAASIDTNVRARLKRSHAGLS